MGSPVVETATDLKQLSLRALVAYAVRCARRVQSEYAPDPANPEAAACVEAIENAIQRRRASRVWRRAESRRLRPGRGSGRQGDDSGQRGGERKLGRGLRCQCGLCGDRCGGSRAIGRRRRGSQSRGRKSCRCRSHRLRCGIRHSGRRSPGGPARLGDAAPDASRKVSGGRREGQSVRKRHPRPAVSQKCRRNKKEGGQIVPCVAVGRRCRGRGEVGRAR